MYRFGIVGAGGIAKAHEKAMLENNDCKLVAVCDTVLERAEDMALRHTDAKSFVDYKEMCKQVEMDAVIINLPHFLHCEVSVYFLERGISVFVEKPMAITVEECDKMIEAAEKSGAKLAVAHPQRYSNVSREIARIIKSGELGKLLMITEMRNIKYVWEGRPKWFLNKKTAGGGIVMNYGAHTVDKFMSIAGERVLETHASLNTPVMDDDIDIELNAQILFKLTGGVSALVNYCGTSVCRPYEVVNYFFSNGEIKYDYEAHELYVNGELREVSQGDSFGTQFEEFMKFLRNEENCVVSAEFGREVIRVVESILNQEHN